MESFLLLTAILSILTSTINGHAIHLNAIKERNDLNIPAPIVARQLPSSPAVAAATVTPTPSTDPTITTPPLETNPTETSPAPTSTIVPPPPPAPSTPDQSFSKKDAVLLCVGLVILGVLLSVLHRVYRRYYPKKYKPAPVEPPKPPTPPTVFELRDCWREQDVMKMREAQNPYPTDEELWRNWEVYGLVYRRNKNPPPTEDYFATHGGFTHQG